MCLVMGVKWVWDLLCVKQGITNMLALPIDKMLCIYVCIQYIYYCVIYLYVFVCMCIYVFIHV
jgi:hypothetical protein